MYKRVFSILIATILCSTLPVMASDVSIASEALSMPDAGQEELAGSGTGGTMTGTGFDDITSLAGSMTISSMMNEKMSLSDALTKNFGLALESSPYFEGGSFHETGLSLDTSMLNTQFENMAVGLIDGYGTTLETMGNSGDVMSLFNSQFGDIASGLTLDQYEIPSSFDPQNMISTMHDSMAGQYADAISTGSFASVKNSIDIGDIFSRANQGLSSDIVGNLMDTSSMKAMLSGMSSGIKGDMMGEYNSKLANNGAPDLDNFYSNAMNNTMNAFDWSNSMLVGGSASANFGSKIGEKRSMAEGYEAGIRAENKETWSSIKDYNAGWFEQKAAANFNNAKQIFEKKESPSSSSSTQKKAAQSNTAQSFSKFGAFK